MDQLFRGFQNREDEKFKALEERIVHQFHIISEGLIDQIKFLAEGDSGIIDKLKTIGQGLDRRGVKMSANTRKPAPLLNSQ